MAITKSSSDPVAIITGGASGIGLSVTTRLVELGWNVMILDFNEGPGQIVASKFGRKVAFLKVDVKDYEQQASAFVETWNKWSRLDFVFANAGHGDKISFYQSVSERANGSPPKPNMEVIQVCLEGVVNSCYLALHYFRKNANRSGKMVSTSSMAGLYPSTGLPLYTAAKHGVVGLTRALAQGLEQQGEPITVNCLCPGLLDTGLTSQTLMPFLNELNVPVTPHSTILEAIETFLNDDSKNGLVAECSTTNIHYRNQPDWGDEEARKVATTDFVKVIRERTHAHTDVKFD